MIVRRAKVQSVTEERIAGGALVLRARVTCDALGIDKHIPLDAAEHAWADHVLAGGRSIVVTITEEPTS